MRARWKKVRRKILRLFEIVERPAAWGLLVGAIATFFGVILELINVGDFKLGTLLIAADLMVSGFSAVQQSEEDEEPEDV